MQAGKDHKMISHFPLFSDIRGKVTCSCTRIVFDKANHGTVTGNWNYLQKSSYIFGIARSSWIKTSHLLPSHPPEKKVGRYKLYTPRVHCKYASSCENILTLNFCHWIIPVSCNKNVPLSQFFGKGSSTNSHHA